MFSIQWLSRCLVILIWSITISVDALEVTPMVVTLSPQEPSKIPSSLVYNQLPREIAFDIEVHEIDFSTPNPSLKKLEDSPLWVFPPSLFLQEGQGQKIQFRWIAESFPKYDKSYQVSLVEQPLASNIDSDTSQLKILMNVNLVVHVHMDEYLPKLKILTSTIESGELLTQVKNEGRGATRLRDYEVKVTTNKSVVTTFEKQALLENGYDVFFAPYATQTIKIKLPENIERGKVEHLSLDLVQ
ncbi:hypothetical protein [Pseudoalteromonas sp. S3785]|uniref:hypothetical protein n=1 Tax=Pseudoalteromonas sp. S3785 TaxID=579545 RepID=UPI00201DE7DC|nr:hypothetical protein [Pseudoalteromonas sp. S3785]